MAALVPFTYREAAAEGIFAQMTDLMPESDSTVPPVVNWIELDLEAGRVFTPNAPVGERDVFAGRRDQLRRVIDAVGQKGQHVMIFGERGVGKTSLANVIAQFTNAQVLSPRVNCDSLDSFDSLWRKLFEQIELLRAEPTVGFSSQPRNSTFSALEWVGSREITPDLVRRVLAMLGASTVVIVVFDEFDRLGEVPRRAMADTIKGLSDHAVPATVVLVGVADSVDQLIDEHASVARALVQVQMPRMARAEIRGIVANGVERLGMSVDTSVLDRITTLAQGLPHYAHLLGLHAVRAAIDAKRMGVRREDLSTAIAKATGDAHQSIRSAYHQAVRSARKDNLFADVLLACALADADELGFFAAQDVRPAIQRITGKQYQIPSFAQHLNEFSDAKRGGILRKHGQRRRYRYRFSDPLMQPFVIMQGVRAGRVPE